MRVLRLVRTHADAAFALFCTVALQVEIWLAGYSEHRAASSAFGLIATLALAFRCRYPLAAFIVTLTGVTAINLLAPGFDNQSTMIVVVIVFALYSYGANARGLQAWAAVVVMPLAIARFVTDDGDSFHVGDIVFGSFIIGGPWLAGTAMRIRRARERSLTQRTVELMRDQDERARAAVAEERRRIARELHDVVAHAISVTVVQARGGRKVLDREPEQARAAFDSIERTGEVALGEMRRLLGLLREEATERAPQPTLERLDSLVEDFRASGLPVEVTRTGPPVELPPGVDLAAYRIVQEALTNALKHAGPAVARVSLDYGPVSLAVTIEDDGAGNGNGNGTGNGLIGVRERVAVVGGSIEAGPRPEGGFSVHASLPYEDAA